MEHPGIARLLSGVEKPARYTGGEWNSITKTQAELYFALCFPDVYEIGMSHLGSHILYHVLNARDEIACERAYAPWPDMEEALRAAGLPLYGLESGRALGDFDVIGFSLLYELCYTNILTMLEVSSIPLLSSERGENHPLVVCGGPCACNSEPLHAFVDAVMIGDGEELILEVADCVINAKRHGLKKVELLQALSRIPGVYIPQYYGDLYDDSGNYSGLERLEPFAPQTVTRRVVSDLDAASYPQKPIVPNLGVVHDRVSLELFRGCTRGCRFCQAGYIYRPVRERQLETLIDYALRLIEATGYDELSLFSLSSGDYSYIRELIDRLLTELSEKRVSLSLPSLRVDAFLKEELERMQAVRKAGLTFAPEAGTQRLRDVINKNVTEEDLLKSVTDAFKAGWSGVKLYFMIGLPTETDEDIQGIAELARKVSRAFHALPRETRKQPLRLSVSASSFVPKPFTPFQWVAQDKPEELRRKQQLLKWALKGIRGVEYKYHESSTSTLEAVFSRGDRRLSRVLLEAYRLGCRFDSWAEHFKAEAWRAAFAASGLDPGAYAHRERQLSEPLPWDHIDMLVDKRFMAKEYERAMQAAVTPDCRLGCHGCFGDMYANNCPITKGG